MNPSGRERDVVVVGAGPTGLMLAAELLRHGVRPLVVDRSPAPSPLSRAIVVHARTLEVLEQSGLARTLVARGQELRRIRMWSNGKVLVDLGFGDLPTAFPFVLCVPQADTEQVLAAHVEAAGGEVLRGVELVSFTADDDGVDVVLSTGTVRARWLVGCDGAHSAVRHGLGLAFVGKAYTQRLVLGDVRWDADLPRDVLTTFLGREFLGCFPLPDGRWRFIAVRDPDDDGEEATLEGLQALVDTRTHVGGRLSDPTWVAPFRIHSRQVERYRVGRVLLAGDAAHIHSPVGGQGMNTGIQDAHNLGWKLALVLAGAPEALLDSYEAERHPVAALVLKATGRATDLGTTRSRVLRAVRDRVAPALAGLSLVRDNVTMAVSELAVRYLHSPIVLQGALSADRPDPGTFLPEHRGAHHRVLLHEGPECGAHGRVRLRICEAVARRDPRIRVERAEPMGMRADGVTVVRPDGYVGARLAPADAETLLTWLDAVLGPPA